MVEAGPSDEARRTAPVRMDFMVMRPGCQSVRRGAIEAGRRVDATMGGHFEGYINLRGERTLRAYSRPLNLARFDRTHPGRMSPRTTSGGFPSTCWAFRTHGSSPPA